MNADERRSKQKPTEDQFFPLRLPTHAREQRNMNLPGLRFFCLICVYPRSSAADASFDRERRISESIGFPAGS